MSAGAPEPVWNVPQRLLAECPAGKLIVRVSDAAGLLQLVESRELPRVVAIELHSLPPEIEDLAERLRGVDVPIDLVLADPAKDAAQLYRLNVLGSDHWTRTTIPVVPGFGRAVSIASSLQLGVRLTIGQPDAALVDELLAALEHYLRGPDVETPVEFFHSLLAVFLGSADASMWDICEDDPGVAHYVSDDGRFHPSVRFEAIDGPGDGADVLPALLAELDNAGGECCDCRYRDVCLGYFKAPDRAYSCEHVKRVFATLENAAGELLADGEMYGEEVG